MAEWRTVKGYPEYQVNNKGRVKRGRLLREYVGKIGYASVTLCNNGERKTHWVHALVAAAFIGPRPERLHVNHKNGIKADNRVENLEYVTCAENHRHAFRTGLSKPHGMRSVKQISVDGRVIAEHASIRGAARKVKTSNGNIVEVCKGSIRNGSKRTTAGGYRWEYADLRESGE